MTSLPFDKDALPRRALADTGEFPNGTPCIPAIAAISLDDSGLPLSPAEIWPERYPNEEGQP